MAKKKAAPKPQPLLEDAPASVPAPLKPGEFAEADIKLFHSLNERRLHLEREAKNIAAEYKPIKDRLFAALTVRAARGERAVIEHGFLLNLKEIVGKVAWKEKYIEIAGAAKALELQESCPKITYIEVKALAQPA